MVAARTAEDRCPRSAASRTGGLRTSPRDAGSGATEISGGGIRIRSQKLIIPDTKIKATLKIDIKNEFYGKVLRALHKNQGTIAVYEIGIETDLIVMDNIKFNRQSASLSVNSISILCLYSPSIVAPFYEVFRFSQLMASSLELL